MLKTTLTISAAVALLTVGSMADNGHKGHGKAYGKVQHQEIDQNTTVEEVEAVEEVETVEVATLTDEQQADLIFMAEEEKVARDVYSYLSEKYDARIFSNIVKSEQRHMDAVEGLLNSYELTVPSTMDEEGIFIDEKLQTMYDDLIAKGDLSLEDAYKVGVEIEETDITDLEELLSDELPTDIEKVYKNLLDGSYSHLRSFNRQLDK
jgi:hypothetical protein